MSELIYSQKVDWLFNQFPVFQKIGETAYKPTLENTLNLINLLEVPVDEMRFVHVAGTNGKGTTCSIIASGLTVAGKKVGLFTSPHIKDFRERIRINGEMISKKKVVEYIRIFQSTSFDFSPSFFEMTWAMALAYFNESKCDIVVAETGLGGRLDATNIITPELSIITNIGLEHINILGDTRQKIAIEKAGIIKRETPVIIGESDPEIESIFISKAKEQEAPIEFLEQSLTLSAFETNKKLAFLALEHFLSSELCEQVKEKAIEHLEINTGLYGRSHVYSKNPLIIMDAAHNEMAIQKFITEIQERYSDKSISVLYGASNDKDLDKIGAILPKTWKYYFTTFNNERSAKIKDFKSSEKISSLNARFFKSATTAFKEAQSFKSEQTVLVVFGSFFLLEEII